MRGGGSSGNQRGPCIKMAYRLDARRRQHLWVIFPSSLRVDVTAMLGRFVRKALAGFTKSPIVARLLAVWSVYKERVS